MVGAKQLETAAMAVGSVQCKDGTGRPRGSQEAGGGQAQPQEAAGSAQAQCCEPQQLAGTDRQARPRGSRLVGAEQPEMAVVAEGSVQCEDGTGRPRGSQEAGGGQAQPQEAAGSAQAQCFKPSHAIWAHI